MIYDVALNNSNEFVPIANESIVVWVSKEFKDDIQKSGNGNEIVRGICFMNEGCVPVGLTYRGFNERKQMYVTEVFYYNPRKDMFR